MDPSCKWHAILSKTLSSVAKFPQLIPTLRLKRDNWLLIIAEIFWVVLTISIITFCVSYFHYHLSDLYTNQHQYHLAFDTYWCHGLVVTLWKAKHDLSSLQQSIKRWVKWWL